MITTQSGDITFSLLALFATVISFGGGFFLFIIAIRIGLKPLVDKLEQIKNIIDKQS